jgi:hypothetical protein
VGFAEIVFTPVSTLKSIEKADIPCREDRISTGFRSSPWRCSKSIETGRWDDLIPAAREAR